MCSRRMLHASNTVGDIREPRFGRLNGMDYYKRGTPEFQSFDVWSVQRWRVSHAREPRTDRLNGFSAAHTPNLSAKCGVRATAAQCAGSDQSIWVPGSL